MSERIGHEPLGVIANISAWNYPYFVGANVFVPALLTGNAVLYKPSEFATLTGLDIAGCCTRPACRATSSCRSSAAARSARRCSSSRSTACSSPAPRHRRAHRRGGRPAHDPAPARARRQGPDLRRRRRRRRRRRPRRSPTARSTTPARAAARSSASTSTSDPRRVRRGVRRRRCEGFKIGDPTDEATYIGAITRAPQLAVLEAQVADALAKGATLRTGGERIAQPGNWFEPTVLHRGRPPMALMRDESFGPIIGIQPVADDDEALALMNDTDYGLTAGVYTRDERARRAPRAGQRRLRLLELLRPGEPAPAVVGPRPLRRRRHAVDATASRPSPAEGLAPVRQPDRRGASHDAPRAVRSRPHAAQRRQRRAVVRVPDRRGPPRPRGIRAAQPPDGRALCQRHRDTGRVLRLLCADARRRAPDAWQGLRERFLRDIVAPRIRRAARALVERHRRGRRPRGADHGDQPLPGRADRRDLGIDDCSQPRSRSSTVRSPGATPAC